MANARPEIGVHFIFPPFKPDYLIIQGDAEITPQGILALTARGRASIGRVFYATEVPIWDPATGNVASFVTSFSFKVEDVPGYPPGQGLVFFLAPPGSQIPPHSDGGNLGIADGDTAFNQFVAVEFDSFTNEWDPGYAHIGINVNSLGSLETVRWERLSGKWVNVTIAYDPLSKKLFVTVSSDGLRGSAGLLYTIAQFVDLKAVLPEKVSVGFSATTTGDVRETHDIRSWSFTSTSIP